MTRLDAYESLEKFKEVAYNYAVRGVGWSIPDSLPQDVIELLEDAAKNYSLAATALFDAAKAGQTYLDSSSIKDLASAKRNMDAASDFIITAEAKINEAKRHLGFAVKQQ